MKARDVATRMRAMGDNITGETGEDAPSLDRVVSVLVGVEYDGLDDVLQDECQRVLDLFSNWYGAHGLKVTPKNVAGLAFVQGVTFAVAARRLAESEHWVIVNSLVTFALEQMTDNNLAITDDERAAARWVGSKALTT